MASGKHSIKRTREKPTALRIVLILLIVALTGVFCVSGYMLAREWISDEAEKSAFNELSDVRRRALERAESEKSSAGTAKPGDPSGSGDGTAETSSEGENETASGDPTEENDAIVLAYQELAEMNPDLFGWLVIEDTPIDYPVMYTPKNEEYYLRRGFDKKYSYSGVPFMDVGCPPDGNHYLIYGHNMKNQTMFGTLTKYLKKDYWESHQIIRFDTLTEAREYQVIAAFRSKAYTKSDVGVFRYYAYADVSTQGRFESYVKNVLRESAFKTGLTAEWGDELLTLSTCDYYTENGRCVVVAKRIK